MLSFLPGRNLKHNFKSLKWGLTTLISLMVVNEMGTEKDLEQIKICQGLHRKMVNRENIIKKIVTYAVCE